MGPQLAASEIKPARMPPRADERPRGPALREPLRDSRTGVGGRDERD